MPTELEHEHEHAHHHPQGRLFEAVLPLWMLVGRGGMARVVANDAALTAADVVVDVGCGPGTAVRRGRRVGAAEVIGVDPNPQMLRLARWITSLQRLQGARFLEGAAERLPLADRSATVIWAIQSVHHWEDRAAGLREVRRVLGPGGRIVLMERFVVPGARGLAAHGLTARHAEQLIAELGQIGFDGVAQKTVSVGRRTFVVITGAVPGG